MSSGGRRHRSPPPPSLEAANSRSASDEEQSERRPSRSEKRTITTIRSGSNSRTRRLTPVVGRSSRARQLSDDYIFNDDDSVSGGSDHNDHDHHRRGHHDHNHHHHHHHHGHDDRHTRHRHVSIDTRSDGLRGAVGAAASAIRRQVTSTSADAASGRATLSSYFTWYERMMPECLLTLTAPITGYERRLVTRPDMDGHELEILERDRLRRNKRIRRRVFTVVLIASLASAYFFWRGRMPGRRVHGVRGAIGSVADGISKSIHDTMGK